jgi:hypothetical protein
MGGETTPGRAVVQSAGHAYELIGKLLKEEFTRAGDMQHLLLRYTRALLTQMAQTAVCNRHHSLDQQLCRRLSPSLDRLSGNELVMTRITVLDRAGLENALVSVLRRGQEGVRSFVARPDCVLIRWQRVSGKRQTQGVETHRAICADSKA